MEKFQCNIAFSRFGSKEYLPPIACSGIAVLIHITELNLLRSKYNETGCRMHLHILKFLSIFLDADINIMFKYQTTKLILINENCF